ncbi:hypothetical protein ABZS66_48310 [Dactylosporangium sp. NPDC005572]|uniref:hypothetical protein n=1 Tax=Dactylosporangium sp. NPDC005572 TaxID=3156889 RepID=UPI0033A8B1F8
MNVTGTLVGDSLRPGAQFAPPGTRIRRVYRLDLGGTAAPTQPGVWTVIDFESDDVAAVAEALAAALNPDGGWYADLRDGADRVVVYAGAVFRYGPGDAETRAAAIAHGRSVGVPEHQLDWDDATT